jgi:hypothetical protein
MSNLVETGEKYDLKIERSIGGDAGNFTGGGWKWVWHTTESSLESVDVINRVLHDKGAEAHWVIGKRDGRWVAIQQVPLNQAARTLRHVFGPETNRANCIQVEICGRAAESGTWGDDVYQALANLVRLTNEERAESRQAKVPWELARSFKDDRRYGPEAFVQERGHLGHKHVPGNDHSDPGDGFKGERLIDLLHNVPERGYYLLNG